MGRIAEPYDELTSIPDKELKRRYDSAAPQTMIGTGHYLDELNRRELARLNRRVGRLMLWVITLALIVILMLAALVALELRAALAAA